MSTLSLQRAAREAEAKVKAAKKKAPKSKKEAE